MGIKRSESIQKGDEKDADIMTLSESMYTSEKAMMNGHYDDQDQDIRMARSACPVAHKLHKLINFQTANEQYDTLHRKINQEIKCKENMCSGSLMSGQVDLEFTEHPRAQAEVIEDAISFLDEYYAELKLSGSEEHLNRKASVLKSLDEHGTYDLTADELVYGAKLAWRNAPRCIGRMQWNKLHVFDCQNVRTTDEMFEALCRHLEYATNDGNIRSVISIFPKRVPGKSDFKIWNPQMLSYAGYEQDDGTVIGDPSKVKLTQICQKLGWKGYGGRFDVLPWVMNASGTDPKYYEIPDELVLQVQLRHPDYDFFEDMDLRWYAVPAVSNMMFEVGGLQFPAAPFNGWYMSSEIGARDLCDRHRYNILEEVALKMGLDTTSVINLWKDQALVEVNRAVLYSFQQQNVTIMDHHSASDSFIKHMEIEQKLRGGCPADWVWIVPPISGGITQVFHQEMLSYNLKPAYNYQEWAWKTHVWLDKNMEKRIKTSGRKISMKAVARSILFATYLMNKYMKQRVKATVVYASETGKSKAYAERIGQVFRRAFNSEVICMNDYDLKNVASEKLLLIVASTFGSGNAPDSGKKFAQQLGEQRALLDANNNNIRFKLNNNHRNKGSSMVDAYADEKQKPLYAVFALGSSAYPEFCAFGKLCDEALGRLGNRRLSTVATADELKGEEQTFKKWAQEVFEAACKKFNISIDTSNLEVTDNLEGNDSWQPELHRLSRAGEQLHDLYEGLSKLHQKKVHPCRMISRVQLQSLQSSRQTILARFDTKGATDMQYSPGDHLGVFPSNRTELVAGIARRLKNMPSLHDPLVVQQVDKDKQRTGRVKVWKDIGRLPPCSILTALTHYLDITTPPTQQFLRLLAKSATDLMQKRQLENLANDDDDYEAWKEQKFPNLLETLQMYDSVRLDATMILKHLPLLQPRFYSISSSAAFCNGEIHATVGVVTFRTEDDGPIHYGVCSNFMNSFPNKDVPCFIRSAPNFALPDDRSKPVIMVGPGTGIAPFRGFWQQRQYELSQNEATVANLKSPTRSWMGLRNVFDCNYAAAAKMVDDELARHGKMTLFFGCRDQAVDDIYRKELAAVVKSMNGFELRVAYSRQPDRPKTYVQDLLKTEGNAICRQLLHEGGHLYVCGEATMAADVRKVLKDVLERHGDMSGDRAESCIQDLKNEGRYHEDIFGILVRKKSN